MTTQQAKERYNPQESEPRIEAFWKQEQVFSFKSDASKPYYSIDTPPPTVSGRMHLGHAFSYTQQDFLARYKRMCGFNVFYPFGTDDNGLATEKLVQKQRKLNLRNLERSEAIAVCLDFLKEERPAFIADWQRLGMSCDFSLCYSTIDDHSRRIAQKSFLDLVKKGLVYRKKGPVMWDRVFQTAIAQAELEDLKRTSHLNYIKAKFHDEENTFIIYATTRPELLYGCVGMSIEAAGDYIKLKVGDEFWITGAQTYEEKFSDVSYEVAGKLKGKDIEGKTVIIPQSGNEVALGDDISVKADFGTGVVYYCTYGGLDCVEWMARHKEVTPIDIMGKDGRLKENCGPYAGMLAEEARKAVVTDLNEQGVLIRREKISQIVNVGERSGVEVEYIVSEQWYVKYLDLKEDFLAASEELNWFPEHMKHRLDNWIRGLNWDWGFSRQRHYGTPIPVWYDSEGNTYYPQDDQLPVDPLKDRPEGVSEDVTLTPETDVFDTWFTSSSSPYLGVELIEDEEIRKKLFPMNLRPQAHDIINFWLFYTMAKTQLLEGKNPWSDVTISGFVLDPKGNKMSKSKGNVIAPQEVIEKYSADAIRYWAGGSKLGEDMPYQEKDVMTGQKTVTKLWNAAKFTFMHLEDYDGSVPEKLETYDQWMLSQIHEIVGQASAAFDKYEYARARASADTLFWKLFCDNYLEIVKDRLYNADSRGVQARVSAQYVLEQGMYAILRLYAPFIPYITEELYQKYLSKRIGVKSIHLCSWPKQEEFALRKEARKAGDIGLEIISGVRRFKSEQKLSLKSELENLVILGDAEELERLVELLEDDLKAVLHAQKISFSGEATCETSRLKLGIYPLQPGPSQGGM